MAQLIEGAVWEASGAWILARVAWSSGYIMQADFSSISYKVWKTGALPRPPTSTAPGARELIVPTTSLTIANVVYDSLQTDAKWTLDTTGYNFAFEIPASTFPAADPSVYANWTTPYQHPRQYYEVPVTFTPSSGEVFNLKARLDVLVL